MKRVYRLENERDGKGIFRSVANDNLNTDLLQKLYSMPIPNMDGIDITLSEKEWFFGFDSLKTFFEQVTFDAFEAFINEDFRLKVIKVCPTCTQIGHSQQQIAFTREGVKRESDITDRLYKILHRNYYKY